MGEFQMLLGFSGVILVVLSVLASVGFFSVIGVKSTLIIMEVIPFLVLAVSSFPPVSFKFHAFFLQHCDYHVLDWKDTLNPVLLCSSCKMFIKFVARLAVNFSSISIHTSFIHPFMVMNPTIFLSPLLCQHHLYMVDLFLISGGGG